MTQRTAIIFDLDGTLADTLLDLTHALNHTLAACDRPAPFRQPGGGAYLEPHHLHRAADFGPDHPRAVAALCPNCHREAHHGERAASMAAALRARLEDREGAPSSE